MKKKNFRFYFAMLCAKAVLLVLRIARKKGGQLPGVIADRICPDFLARIDRPEKVIVVTGSHGKTTVSNLIDDLLLDNGFDPLTNRGGGNVKTGIITTLLKEATLRGRQRKKLAVLELDERSARLVFPSIAPDLMVVTNLFRDSFTRNAHVGYVFDILSAATPPSVRLVLNGDDLISCRLAPENPRAYYGIERQEDDWESPYNIVRDIRVCPLCGAPLKYDFARYNHIGRARCTACDFGSPSCEYDVTKVDRERMRFTLRERDGSLTEYKLPGGNIIDLYNTLAAVSCLREFGIPAEGLRASLEKRKLIASRYNEMTAGEKTLIMITAKGESATACSRAFDYIRRQEGKKAVVLMLEDFYEAKHSTENTGWIYETDFEFLADPDIVQIIASGVRSRDMRLRLLLAGVPEDKILIAADGNEAAALIDIDTPDRIYWSYAVFNTPLAEQSRELLRARIEREGKAEHHE